MMGLDQNELDQILSPTEALEELEKHAGYFRRHVADSRLPYQQNDYAKSLQRAAESAAIILVLEKIVKGEI